MRQCPGLPLNVESTVLYTGSLFHDQLVSACRTACSALLTALLVLEFPYHTPVPWSDLPLTLWAYPMPFPMPFLVHVLPILGIVGWALWQRRRDADAPSVNQGVGYVEPVVRYAGLGLEVFVIGYGCAAPAGFHSVLGEFWPVLLLGAAQRSWGRGCSACCVACSERPFLQRSRHVLDETRFLALRRRESNVRTKISDEKYGLVVRPVR